RFDVLDGEFAGRDNGLELCADQVLEALAELRDLAELLRVQAAELVLDHAPERAPAGVEGGEDRDEAPYSLGGSARLLERVLEVTEDLGVTPPADLREHVALARIVDVDSGPAHARALRALARWGAEVALLRERVKPRQQQPARSSRFDVDPESV